MMYVDNGWLIHPGNKDPLHPERTEHKDFIE